MTSNLQIALISKRIELLGRDWTQMKDFLKLFPDLTNFPYLSFTKVRLFMWTKTYALGSTALARQHATGVAA